MEARITPAERCQIPRYSDSGEGLEQGSPISSGEALRTNAERQLASKASCLRQTVGPFDVQVMFEGIYRARFETELLDAQVALPLTHLAAWERDTLGRQWFVAVRDATGKARAGFAFDVAPSRALPGQLILRCCRMRWHFDLHATLAAIEAIANLVRRRWNVLRVHLELFEPQLFDDDPAEGEALRIRLGQLGFLRAAAPRVYEQTVVIDLQPSEEEIFAAFHKTGRQNVRRAARQPVEIRPVYDTALGARLNNLLEEVMQRTGGEFQARDWAAILRFSARYPRLSRVMGVFHTEVEGPESLVAFAWAQVHGDHAEYNAAAATRDTTLRISLAYAPAWELIRWAKASGCQWFDFGGITAGTFGKDDRLGGISDFKRYFTRETVTVSQEWILRPSKAKSNLATGISRLVALTRFRGHPMRGKPAVKHEPLPRLTEHTQGEEYRVNEPKKQSVSAWNENGNENDDGPRFPL